MALFPSNVIWAIIARIIRAILTILADTVLEVAEAKAREKEIARTERDNGTVTT